MLCFLQEALEEQNPEAGPDRWKQLMQKLLVVLDTGTVTSPEDLTSDPEAARSLNPFILLIVFNYSCFLMLWYFNKDQKLVSQLILLPVSCVSAVQRLWIQFPSSSSSWLATDPETSASSRLWDTDTFSPGRDQCPSCLCPGSSGV